LFDSIRTDRDNETMPPIFFRSNKPIKVV